MESIISYAALALWFAYTARKLRVDLHMAQQNGHYAYADQWRRFAPILASFLKFPI